MAPWRRRTVSGGSGRAAGRGEEDGREPWECGGISATRIVASRVSSAWLPTTLLFARRVGREGKGRGGISESTTVNKHGEGGGRVRRDAGRFYL